VTRDLDLGEDSRDTTVSIDDHRSPFYAHVLSPVQGFLLPDSERVSESVTFVGEEQIGQAVFLFELSV
jgi:hypothetical protein